jgi:hypothetical protein
MDESIVYAFLTAQRFESRKSCDINGIVREVAHPDREAAGGTPPGPTTDVAPSEAQLMPRIHAKSHRESLGFRDGEKGTHSSRTLMLNELEQVLAATPPEATIADFRRAVVEDNVLGKRTTTTREHTIRKLKALYGLNPAIPVYRVMRRIWADDPEGRPLLALMCAVARDPLLRASVSIVLEAPLSSEVDSKELATTVRPAFSTSTREAIVSHLVSSWTMAGFLTNTSVKTRSRAHATPGAAAYALALGYMEGTRGRLLLSTSWTRLLDRSPEEVLTLVQHAARRSWVEYRAAGDIMDIRVEALFTDEERVWCDGQPG